MELRAFAEQLLFDTSFAGKLLEPGDLTDVTPGAAFVGRDVVPGRPAELAFLGKGTVGGRAKGERSPFPSASELEKEEARGRVLHAFANHELLALELMALALLRFPGAPTKFRLGLAATIAEEQKHLKLYVARMATFGVPFGGVAVNRFFWDAVAPVETPLNFVAAMSLTLEQANLDFSRHYRDLFQRLGDRETAALLDLVYREEIGHVKHGVTWFQRWRDPALGEWEGYLAALAPPLTASRAKGIGFAAEPRRQAGLSDDFIAALAVHNQSKGRPPIVYWLNVGCEDEVANGRASFVMPKRLRELETDLGGVMSFLARPDDIVVVERRPGVGFLTALHAAGFVMPQFVDVAKAYAEIGPRLCEKFEPWGKSPASARRYESLGGKWQVPYILPEHAEVFSKAWSAALYREIAPETARSIVCRDLDGVDRALGAFGVVSDKLLKAPLGSSGRHMHRVVASAVAEIPGNLTGWVTKILSEQGSVLVEPWDARVVDLSVQIQVEATGVTVLGVTRFLTDARGQYVAHRLGRKLDDLAPPLRRRIYEGRFFERLSEIAQQVGDALRRRGFIGPAGIDAYVYAAPGDPQEFHLRPLVEINARFTMGRVALALDQRILPSAEAGWFHVGVRDVEGFGFTSLAALAAAWAAEFPLRLRHGLIESGVLPTTDPTAATMMATFIVAGAAYEMLAPRFLEKKKAL